MSQNYDRNVIEEKESRLRKMKRKVSESIETEAKDIISDLTHLSYDSVMELINNRQSCLLKEVLDHSFKDINLKNDDSLLMRASKVGDEECAKLLIAYGADMSFVSHYSGHTALSLACCYGHESIVNLLLEEGVDVNLPEDRLPIVEACRSGYTGVVSLLLKKGALINQCLHLLCKDEACFMLEYDDDPHYHDGPNALMAACDLGDIELVQFLLDQGADVCACLTDAVGDIDGLTPIAFASRSYHWDVVKLLVARGVDINETLGERAAKYHSSPLMYACAQGNIDVVKELLGLGADINDILLDYDGTPPDSSLTSASAHGHLDLVKFILTHEEFIPVQDTYTAVDTVPFALVKACEGKHMDTIAELRSHISDLNALTALGSSVLSIASAGGNVETVKLLLEMGAAVDVPATAGVAALTQACFCNRYEVAKLLLEHGASADAKDYQGRTPLLMAVCRSWGYSPRLPLEPLITLLVEHGADVNAVDKDGKTTLMTCVTNRLNVSVVKLLLDYGTDVTAKNREGKTVLDLLQGGAAKYHKHRGELIALFKEYEESNRKANLSNMPVLK